MLKGLPFVATQQTYFISLPVLMFAPAATLAFQTKPMQQPQRTTQPASDLMIALAKLTLQHEQERQNRARRECCSSGVRVSPDDAETRSYGRDVRSRRENSESQPGGQYAGHTQGKQPDALFRGVLYRLAENVRENQQVVEQRLQTEETVAAALKRVLKVGEQAAQNRDLKALRSFRAGHRSVDLRSFSTATTNRGVVDSPRSQDTGTSTRSPTGRLCSQNQGGQASATAGLWDGTRRHQEQEENPQTQGPDRRRGGLITHYFVRREGN